MNTINTIEDLLRLVREDKEVRAALRRELLTEELLALPDRFAVGQQTQDRIQEGIVEIRQTQDRMQEELAEFLQCVDQRFRAVDRRMDNMENHLGRISQDFSIFRGNYSEVAAARNAIGIAPRLSAAKAIDIYESEVEVLSKRDLQALARAYGADKIASIPIGDRESFYLSDLTIKVQKADGEIFYTSVETSYTCDQRDVDRAISHAVLLTKFTGREGLPAICGVRADRNAQNVIDSDTVFWYPLDAEEMRPAEPA